MTNTINVFIIDDSPVIRRLFDSILRNDERITIIGEAEDGQDALNKISTLKAQGKIPDVVTLDIEMPIMDGLEVLPKLHEMVPSLKVLMVSSLTVEGGEKALKALSMGASECVAKPLIEELGGAQLRVFGEQVRAKVIGLGGLLDKPSLQAMPVYHSGDFVLREKTITAMPNALAIGASTGGPNALIKLLSNLGERLVAIPIFITQHMPETFVKLLADQLTRETNFECVEATEGLVALPGKVYIAPGKYHLKLEKNMEGELVCRYQDTPSENFCKPAVDPMLRSLIDATDGRLLVAILTGMGADGLKGCEYAVEKGAIVVAQDRETSVIWGMPGAVAQAGLCTAVEPLDKLGGVIAELSQGKIV